MPVCPNCGKEVGETVEYCPDCSQRLRKGFAPEERDKYIQELGASIAEEKQVEREQAEERKREQKEARKKEIGEDRKKSDEEWAKKPKATRIAIIVGIIAVMVVVPVILCSRPATTPAGILAETLGRAKGDTDSGVSSATYDEVTLDVEYHFFPLGQFAIEKEASLELVPMFKKMFSRTSVSEVTVHVMGPFRDQYANITWEPVLTLGITRASFEKINWSNMADTEFYMACDTYWKRP